MSKKQAQLIKYLTGDATEPVKVPAIIAHVCNDKGGWGKGFVMALSNKWMSPEASYRLWFGSKYFAVGKTQFVPVGDYNSEIYVANMIAQRGYQSVNNPTPLDYMLLEVCLKEVNERAKEIGATVHMPRIGTGLGGGDWDVISSLLEEIMEVETYVYDLPEEKT